MPSDCIQPDIRKAHAKANKYTFEIADRGEHTATTLKLGGASQKEELETIGAKRENK
jgi:hypothetical protein